MVLDCFALARRPLGNGEVAEQTGLPRATVSRLIATLVRLGHLRSAPERDRYEMAAGVVRLAQAFLGAIDVRHFARPHVVALAEATGVSAFLGVRDGDDMLVIEGARSRSPVLLLGADIGTRMYIATSALGRAWLAAVPDATRVAIIDRWRSNPNHVANAGQHLDTAIDEAWHNGFAISLGEWHPTINSVAVPIRTPSGQVISMNCGGAAFTLPRERIESVLIPQLMRAAQGFANDIGGLAGIELMRARNALPSDRVSPGSGVPASKRRRDGVAAARSEAPNDHKPHRGERPAAP